MPAWFFASLRGYRIGWLPRDIVAGVMLAAIAIPGQLATARLAGMPPETGLYAFAAGSLTFAAFGANRFMSVAADSTIAPIFAGGVASLAAVSSPHYAELVTLLALMVGAILVAVGLLRAGWLATLLSIPVTTGFLAGIAIHIIVGELPTLLGISEEHGHLLLRLFHILGRLGEANPYSLALGVGVLVVNPGHRQDQLQDSRGTDRRSRRRHCRGAVPPPDPRREFAGRIVRPGAATSTSVPIRGSRTRPAGSSRPRRRHGLHHADLSGGEHLSFG